MLKIDIPGRGLLSFEVLVLDYNGTIALDGEMPESVKQDIIRLSEFLEIHIITSDTFGTVIERCHDLPVLVKVLHSHDHTKEKTAYLEQFHGRQVVAVGNGANDHLMLQKAQMGIVVCGPEGCATKTLLNSDIVVNRIEDAFALLLKPKRLVATLRR